MEKTKLVSDIDGNNYSIPFPKVRHQLDIESKKQLLSNGTYGLQERANTEDSTFNLNLIDAVAHFSVLCPEMIKALVGKADDIYEMDLIQAKWLFKAWKQVGPWLIEIRKEINKEMFSEEPIKDTEVK